MLKPQHQSIQRGPALGGLNENKLLSLKVDFRQLLMEQEEGLAVQGNSGACVALHAEGVQPRVSMSFDKDTQELDFNVIFWCASLTFSLAPD